MLQIWAIPCVVTLNMVMVMILFIAYACMLGCSVLSILGHISQWSLKPLYLRCSAICLSKKERKDGK